MKLKWNEPKELPSGKYVKSTYIQDEDVQEFWDIWNDKKEEIKEYGFSIKKYNEKWQLNFWSDDNNTDIINNTCNDLCNKLGFIEKSNNIDINVKKDEILNFLNGLQDEFIENNCPELLDKINKKIKLIFEENN